MDDKTPAICPCKRLKCPRHGDCAACLRHHEGNKHPAACRRLPKTKAKPEKKERV